MEEITASQYIWDIIFNELEGELNEDKPAEEHDDERRSIQEMVSRIPRGI